MKSNKVLFWLAAGVTVLIWGTAYTLIAVIVPTVSPAWLVAGRTSLAALILIAYALWRGHRFPPLFSKVWLWYSLMGFIGMTLPFFLTASGQQDIESGLTSILAGTMPLLTLVMAHFFIPGERMTGRKTLGFVIGFIGIILLFIPLPLSLHLVAHWQAQLLILGTAFCYAVLTIIAKRAPHLPASLGAAMMISSAAVFSLIWALSDGMPRTMPPAKALWALLALAVGATALAQILYLRLIQLRGPGFVAKLVYLVPVVSVIAGILFLNEPFSWRTVLAMVIVFAGLYISRSTKIIQRENILPPVEPGP